MSDARTSGASVSAPALKTGPVSDDEMAAYVGWLTDTFEDVSLARSCGMRREGERSTLYLFVRALRAGVRLEDLL